MQKKLCDNYVLLIKHHLHIKKRPSIPDSAKQFAFDVTNTLTIDELLASSDICISDYSSLIFEFSLSERPMIFFAYDLDDYNDWRGFYYDYDALTPKPVIKTTDEIIDYIQYIDQQFCQSAVLNFKNKFMSARDGHATERIIEKVMKD